MNLSATTFDLANARECLDWSFRAYGGGPYRSATADPHVICDSGTDTTLLVVEFADYIIVAACGTKSIRNWITDAEFDRIGFGGNKPRVHEGFFRAWESVSGKLIQCFRQIVVNGRPIYLCGHSLGGALVTLMAKDLKVVGYTIGQVYTFGQPRVGNAAFKNLYAEEHLLSQIFRVVYEEDIVARIPYLPSFIDPYRHIGKEILLDVFGEIETNPSLVRLLRNDFWGIWNAGLNRLHPVAALLSPEENHHIQNYLKRLSPSND